TGGLCTRRWRTCRRESCKRRWVSLPRSNGAWAKTMNRDLPRLLFTLGDVAGIGPEIVARAWPDLLPLCRPVVVGDPVWLHRALRLVGSSAQVQTVSRPAERDATTDLLPCLHATAQDLTDVAPGKV